MPTTNSPCRVAVITGLPTPYREPVLEEFASRPGIQLRVFYAARGHQDVGWSETPATRSYDHVFLHNSMPERGRRLPLVGYLTLGLTSELDRFRPDYLIIYGYNQISQWLALEYAHRRKIPFAFRSDSNAHLDTRTDARSRLRRWIVSQVVKRAHAVLPVGTANRLFWQSLGARSSQVFNAPYAVDNDAIAREASKAKRDPLGPVRLLYVGRLLPRKGVDILMSAFNHIVTAGNLHLTIIGHGPVRNELQSMQTEPARKQTDWLGKCTNQEVARALGGADLFVLPSRYEPWGLVVNEAMAAGLPVIAHRHVGAAIDLIRPGITGDLYHEHTPDALIDVLMRWASDREALAEMGRQAKDRISRWSIAGTVDGMVAAVRSACPLPSSPITSAVSREVIHEST